MTSASHIQQLGRSQPQNMKGVTKQRFMTHWTERTLVFET
jgi:hypothetical protein